MYIYVKGSSTREYITINEPLLLPHRSPPPLFPPSFSSHCLNSFLSLYLFYPSSFSLYISFFIFLPPSLLPVSVLFPHIFLVPSPSRLSFCSISSLLPCAPFDPFFLVFFPPFPPLFPLLLILLVPPPSYYFLSILFSGLSFFFLTSL